MLNITGLTESFISNIFLQYGSVESALNAGYITSSIVLFKKRESDLSSSFAYNVAIYALSNDNILVSGLGHTVSVPEPNTVLLLAIGCVGVIASRKQGTKAKPV